MSRADLEVRATQLRDQGVPFVRARVVLAERPTSAKAGDEAIIHADGSIEGFVGGTCAETTVRAQSLMLLDSKEPLLLRITPTEEQAQQADPAQGTLTVHNPCLSGGTLEIFLDPVVPPPLVQVLGDGPIAAALRSIGRRTGVPGDGGGSTGHRRSAGGCCRITRPRGDRRAGDGTRRRRALHRSGGQSTPRLPACWPNWRTRVPTWHAPHPVGCTARPGWTSAREPPPR